MSEDGYRTSFGVTNCALAASMYGSDWLDNLKQEFKEKHLATLAADGGEFDGPVLRISEGVGGSDSVIFDWISMRRPAP